MSTLFAPSLELICGPVCSGKTGELIRRLTLARIAGLSAPAFKPNRDTRQTDLRSRNGSSLQAIEVAQAEEILAHTELTDRVIGIDEAQFFDPALPGVALALVRQGKRVIVSGLDLDFEERPFEVVAALAALASPVIKLTAVCMKCKEREASRSQRLTVNADRILVGDKEYEPRCLVCYVPPQRL